MTFYRNFVKRLTGGNMENYEKMVAEKMIKTGWRYGQTLFNVLYENDPEAANSIRGTEFDPFYLEPGNARMLFFWNWYYGYYYNTGIA